MSPSNSLLGNSFNVSPESSDPREVFIQNLLACEIWPREIAKVVADIFFSGDIDDPTWVKQVLTRDCRGFLAPRGQRLMYSFWCTSRGLPYDKTIALFNRQTS